MARSPSGRQKDPFAKGFAKLRTFANTVGESSSPEVKAAGNLIQKTIRTRKRLDSTKPRPAFRTQSLRA